MLLYLTARQSLSQFSDASHVFAMSKANRGKHVWHLHTDLFYKGFATGTVLWSVYIGFKNSITGETVGGYMPLSLRKPIVSVKRMQMALQFYTNQIKSGHYTSQQVDIQTTGYDPLFGIWQKRKSQPTYAGYWHVGTVPASDFDFTTFQFNTLDNIQNYESKSGTYADCFFDPVDNNYVLVENEFDNPHDTAIVDLFSITEGWQKQKTRILDTKFHASYPVSFCVDGDYYAVPNAHAVDGIAYLPVFKRLAVDKWEQVDYTIKIPQSRHGTYPHNARHISNYTQDFTPFINGDKWYCFTSTPYCDVVHLYTADNPFDTWVEHPMSPIMVGLNGSRPAGNVIEKNGKLYRLGQDCSLVYGGGVMVYEIKNLSPTNYTEKFITKIAMPYLGNHTFNLSGDKIIFDYRY